jgi:hypothetical protein
MYCSSGYSAQSSSSYTCCRDTSCPSPPPSSGTRPRPAADWCRPSVVTHELTDCDCVHGYRLVQLTAEPAASASPATESATERQRRCVRLASLRRRCGFPLAAWSVPSLL